MMSSRCPQEHWNSPLSGILAISGLYSLRHTGQSTRSGSSPRHCQTVWQNGHRSTANGTFFRSRFAFEGSAVTASEHQGQVTLLAGEYAHRTVDRPAPAEYPGLLT